MLAAFRAKRSQNATFKVSRPSVWHGRCVCQGRACGSHTGREGAVPRLAPWGGPGGAEAELVVSTCRDEARPDSAIRVTCSHASLAEARQPASPEFDRAGRVTLRAGRRGHWAHGPAEGRGQSPGLGRKRETEARRQGTGQGSGTEVAGRRAHPRFRRAAVLQRGLLFPDARGARRSHSAPRRFWGSGGRRGTSHRGGGDWEETGPAAGGRRTGNGNKRSAQAGNQELTPLGTFQNREGAPEGPDAAAGAARPLPPPPAFWAETYTRFHTSG